MPMVQKQSPVAKTIDYTPLTRHISKTDVQTFFDSQGLSKKVKNTKIATIIMSGIIVLFILPTIFSGGAKAIVGLGMALIVVALVVAIVLLIEHRYKRAARFWYFARANNFSYRYFFSNPAYTGMIFQQGHSRHASNIIYVPENESFAAFEMGDYQYTTGSGKERETHDWFYMSIEMDRQLPHMVLDSRANNVKFFGKDLMTNLPEPFSKDQILSLEGDFNTSFTLYAPKEYERDALYIFTPDLMTLLMDQSTQFDAEIIDNEVYFYHRYSVDRLNPTTMYQLLTIIHTIGMKMYRQTDYYADERVGNRANDVVAQGGRRLKQGVNWFVVVIMIIIFAVWIIPNFVRH